jgi:hypothetical protein
MGRSRFSRMPLLAAAFFGSAGLGALLIGAFARDDEFRGARAMPKMVPLARAGFILVGCLVSLLALMFAVSGGPL